MSQHSETKAAVFGEDKAKSIFLLIEVLVLIFGTHFQLIYPRGIMYENMLQKGGFQQFT